MSDHTNERAGDTRNDALTNALDAVSAAHDAVPRSEDDGFLASVRRICGVAERMLAPGARRVRSGDSASTSSPSHPLGSIAEHLAATTIATFGGRGAVRDLRKWMLRAERKDRSSR